MTETLEQLARETARKLHHNFPCENYNHDSILTALQQAVALKDAENERLQSELDQAHAAGAAMQEAVNALESAISEGLFSEHTDTATKSDIYNRRIATTLDAALSTTAGAELLERVRTAEAERDNLRERLKSINTYAALEGPKLVARAAQLEAERDMVRNAVSGAYRRVVTESIPYIKGQLAHDTNKAAYELWRVIANLHELVVVDVARSH